MNCDIQGHKNISYICTDSKCSANRLVCVDCLTIHHNHHRQKCIDMNQFCENQIYSNDKRINELKEQYERDITKLEIFKNLLKDLLKEQKNQANLKENFKYLLTFKDQIQWDQERQFNESENSTNDPQDSNLSNISSKQFEINMETNRLIQNEESNAETQRNSQLSKIQLLQQSVQLLEKVISNRPTGKQTSEIKKSVINSFRNNQQINFQPKIVQTKQEQLEITNLSIKELKKQSIINISQSKNNLEIDYFLQGYDYFQRKQYHEALQLFNLAIEQNSSNEQAWVHKVLSLAEIQNHQEAFQTIEEAKKLFPELIDIYIIHGIILEAQKIYEEALEQYKICTQKSPQSVEGWYSSGFCQYQLGNFDSAQQYFEQAINLNIQHKFAQFYLGIIKQHNQEFLKAEIHFKVTIQLDRDCSGAYYHLANCLKHQDKFEEALQANYKFQELQPSDWVGYIQKGEILFLKDGLQEAKKVFDQLLQVQPDLAGLIQVIIQDLLHQIKSQSSEIIQQ